MFSTFSLATLLQVLVLSFAGGYLACALLATCGVRFKRGGKWPW